MKAVFKVFAEIVFVLSLIWSSFLLIFYLSTEVDLNWQFVFLVIIPVSLAIGGIIYLCHKTLLKGENLTKLIIILLAILFVVFIWPTPYKYIGVGHNMLFRVNRITGEARLWSYGEWLKY